MIVRNARNSMWGEIRGQTGGVSSHPGGSKRGPAVDKLAVVVWTWCQNGRYGERQIALSLLGVLVLAFVVPALFPLWWVKSAGGTLLSHAAALKLDTDVIAGLALAGDYLSDAQNELEGESESIETERDAFRSFAESVQSISTAGQPAQGGTIAHATPMGTGGAQLEEVERAYRRTVMSIPDYRSEYDEQFAEHFTAEFGSDVATIVFNGQRFSEPIQQLVVEKAHHSAEKRQALLDCLDTEARSLRSASSQLEPVREQLDALDSTDIRVLSVEELVETDDRIRTSQRRCEGVLEDRQHDIHDLNRRVDGDSFVQRYVYRQLPVSFPAVQTALSYAHRLDRHRSTLVRTLCRRP